jgi:transposase
MVGRLVWEHPWPCRPTAASNKHESEAPASGPSVRPAGNGPPSCSPQGRTQAEVAAELDVSRQSASRWRARWQADGATALRTRGPTGRPPKVPDTALERIAVVIQGLTGVALSNPSVWRLLSERLGWSAQRPQRQAKERDEEAIQHWVAHEWPRSNKGPAQDRPGLSSSTNQAAR